VNADRDAGGEGGKSPEHGGAGIASRFKGSGRQR
jgi:hypothetical protein